VLSGTLNHTHSLTLTLTRCNKTEMRWNKEAVSRSSPGHWLIFFLLLKCADCGFWHIKAT